MERLEELLNLNVNNFTEKKNGLTYLSWANGWEQFLRVYPDATYTVKKNTDGTPCFGNSKFGYMVYTEVTADNITREMWLFVMDGANKSMKDDAYEYTTKYGKKSVEAISMFDINKTLMRCLTKNLAMFGLGLYIYAGEDIPEAPQQNQQQSQEPTIRQQISNVLNLPNIPKADKDKTIEQLKSGQLPVNEDTLEKLIAMYGVK